MKIWMKLHVALSIMMLLVFSGCMHAHRVVNVGDAMLVGVTVSSGERSFGHGYLPPGAVKGYSGSMKIRRSPPPVVSWKTAEDGEVLSQAVILDEESNGRDVVFELDGRTVKASARD